MMIIPEKKRGKKKKKNKFLQAAVYFIKEEIQDRVLFSLLPAKF